MIDTASDPRQPRRLEKKANIVFTVGPDARYRRRCTTECYAECMGEPTARIVLTRRSPNDVQQRQVFVSIDGERVAALNFGDAVARDVAAGAHLLRAHNTLVWKTIGLELKPGEEARFTIVNRPGPGTRVMLALLGTGPIYLTFERERL